MARECAVIGEMSDEMKGSHLLNNIDIYNAGSSQHEKEEL